MKKNLELKLEDLKKITGGVLDPQVQEFIFFVIAVAKESGETLDSTVAMMYANGNSQEAIDFLKANW